MDEYNMKNFTINGDYEELTLNANQLKQDALSSKFTW